MSFLDKVELNPKISLEKGKIYPFIEMSNVGLFRREPSFVDEKIFTSGVKFEDGDTVVARITPCLQNGKGFYCHGIGKGFGSTEYLVFRPKDESVDNQYLYYLMQTSFIRESMIKSMVGATGRQRVNNDVFDRIEVDFPDIEIQRKIVDILSAYDNLIENNQKQIKLLEEAAQRLYKEWFVDLHFPGYEDTEIANSVPKGWKIMQLSNYCYVTDGTHDSPKAKSSGIPLVTGKCIKNGYINFTEANLISEEDHEKIKVRSGLSTGDILFSNIGTVGSTCRVDYDREFSVKNVIILKPTSNSQSFYLYYWISSRFVQDSFLSQTNGSSQQFIGLNAMRKTKIVIPTEDIISKFEDLIDPVVSKKDALYLQNLKLIESRERLLPKLMSGELEV